MARKSGLPADRHHEIGLELARMRDRLTSLTVEIMNAYPRGSQAHRLASCAEGPIDSLRAEMDRRYYAEHSDASGSAYYPAPELRDGGNPS
jgi:hypothetical protein